MSNLLGVAVPAALSLLSLLALAFLWARHVRRMVAAEFGALGGEQRALLDELGGKLVAAEGELKRVSALAAEEYRKRTEVVSAVAVVEGERNVWKEKFLECAIGHGAAQQMLLRERERLILQLRQAGKTPKVDPTVERVTQEFRDTWVVPATAEKGERISGGAKP